MGDEVSRSDEAPAGEDRLAGDDLLHGYGQTGYLLPYAVIASTFVLGMPLLAVLVAVISMSAPNPSALIAVAALVAAVAVMAGIFVWNRRPESAIVSFEELLPWRAVARARAERRLAAVSDLLGFGNPREARAAAPPTLTTLYQLVAALEAKDPYTHRHSGRVERHVRRTAMELELETDDVEKACRAAALHDVGKIQVPDEILRKPGELAPKEWQVIAEHPDAGARLVAGAVDEDVADAIRHHHERWDGGGYPNGLEGEAIPLFARMIAVADTFDALTSARPYRPGLSRSEARDIIEAEAGRQLDPTVVDAFFSSLSRRTPLALLFLPGLWRRITLPARAAGSSVAASAAATAVIITSGAVPIAPPPPEPVVQAAEVEVNQVLRGAPRKPPITEEKKQEKVKKRGKRGRPARRGSEREKSAAGADAPAADGPAVFGGDPPGGPAAAPEAPPENTNKPANPPASQTKDPPGDPQPDKGKDCPGGGNGGGKGNEKHCG